MDTNSASPAVIKEFQFYPDSHITLLVFADDTTAEFKGKDNFDAAFRAAHHAVKEAVQFELSDEAGKTAAFSAPQGTLHETFDA
jgi:hypothetical protein